MGRVALGRTWDRLPSLDLDRASASPSASACVSVFASSGGAANAAGPARVSTNAAATTGPEATAPLRRLDDGHMACSPSRRPVRCGCA